jgi:hypothetical protein
MMLIETEIMGSSFSIEDIALFFSELGEPSILGCDEYDVEGWISFCQERYPEKGVCTVKKWAIVECQCNDNEKFLLNKMGLQPTLLNTSCVIWDSRNRWSPGSFACSQHLLCAGWKRSW